MTPMLLSPGPLTGDRLMACWPRLRGYVVEALQGQPEDVRELMAAVLRVTDQNPMDFVIADEHIVGSFLGAPIVALPLAVLAGDDEQAH